VRGSGVPHYERPGWLVAGLLFFVVVDVANVAQGEWVSAIVGVVIAILCGWQLRRLRAERGRS
jgi:hypothetical protein